LTLSQIKSKTNENPKSKYYQIQNPSSVAVACYCGGRANPKSQGNR